MENLPLKSEADYRTALKEVDALMATELDTREGRLLDILVTLVEAYEHEHHRFDS
jgi:HTH-type transcriptional regulator/antitoxin HigA